MVHSSHAEQTEIDAAAAQRGNIRIPAFGNSIEWVF
jgi:hypothetical protein